VRFQHESQKSHAPSLEGDGREFGRQAEDSASATSRLFDALGLSDYEAMETFHRWTILV